MEEITPNLEILYFADHGYKPLVLTSKWQVALLNWEPQYKLSDAVEIERHVNTDEVFVLWRGKGALYVATPEGMRVEDLQPGVIYNVPKGTWHGCLATQDVSWIIVEDRDTHLHDTEIRKMTPDELVQLTQKAPVWAE